MKQWLINALAALKQMMMNILLAAVAALAPIHAIMISVGALIFIDLFTGIWASLKRKEKIQSAIMRRTISKIVIYQLAVISAFILETYLLPSVPTTKIVAGVIGLVEFKSVIENSNTIVDGDVFRSILRKLGSENDKG